MDLKLEQARAHFVQGVQHFEANRLHEARGCFEASLELAPGRTSVSGNLGITLFRLGLFHDAVPFLVQATTADPQHAEAWLSLGLCHEAQGNPKEAANALARGVALMPAAAPVWLIYAQCLGRTGAAREALRAVERALDADERLGEAWSVRGSLLREMYRLEEAAQCFEKAIALGADADLNGYYLAAVRGADAPAAPPRRYVENLFDDYSDEFHVHLVEHLGYRGHERLVRPLLESGQRYRCVLDLGCGTGLCGALVAPIANVLDGVDVSQAMLEQARALGVYCELVHADLARFLAATDRQADLVLAADVFIYVGALDEVFRNVRRILLPGGCFAFTVELPPCQEGFRLLSSLRYGHSEDYIRKLADTCGFTVCEVVKAPLRADREEALDALYCYLR